MSNLKCCMCGRWMHEAAVYIGHLPVGPKCAKKAGLIEPARRGRGDLRLGPRVIRQAQPDNETMSLFEVLT